MDPPSQCGLCLKLLQTQQGLLSHLKAKHSECKKCGKWCLDKLKKEMHEEVDHSESSPLPPQWICNTCDQNYPSEEKLQDHERAISYCYCGTCSRYFDDKVVLEWHFRFSGHLPGFPCGPCNRKFKNQKGLNSHLNSKRHKTTISITNFAKAASATAQMKAEEAADPVLPPTTTMPTQSYYCHDCLLEFTAQHFLDRHMSSTVHNPPQFSCLDCELDFANKNSLARHRTSMIHTPLQYTCKTCSVVVFTRKDFDNHLASIPHLPPLYLCEQCDLEFSTALSFEKHITSGEHLLHCAHVCEQCDSAFSTEPILRGHVAKKHETLLDSDGSIYDLVESTGAHPPTNTELTSDYIKTEAHSGTEDLLGSLSESSKYKETEREGNLVINKDVYELIGPQDSGFLAEKNTTELLSANFEFSKMMEGEVRGSCELRSGAIDPDGELVTTRAGPADCKDLTLENAGPSETKIYATPYELTAIKPQVELISVTIVEGLQEKPEMMPEDLEEKKEMWPEKQGAWKQWQDAMPLEQGPLQEQPGRLQGDKGMKQEKEESHKERTGLQEEPMVSPEEQRVLREFQGATGPSVDPQSGSRKFSNLHFDYLLGNENEVVEGRSDMGEEESGEDSFFSCVEDP